MKGVSALVWLVLLQPVPVAPPRVLQAVDVVALLAAGQALDEVGVEVQGDVDLRSLDTVRVPLRCRGCTFTGGIDGSDVRFEGQVDLSGARIARPVTLRGATFAAPFLLASTADRATRLSAALDLVQARFEDVASLDGATLLGRVGAEGARFGRAAFFVATEFRDGAAFDRVDFGGDALFGGGSFAHASFTGATFGAGADFRQRHFTRTVAFDEATFRDRANFTLATFDDLVSFDGAGFRSGASFRLVSTADRASWRRVEAQGPLDFTGAVFEGGASFSGLAAADQLSLSRVRTPPGSELELDQMAAGRLALDVGLVDDVRGAIVQRDVLRRLEQTAQAAGDLGLANDARYRLLALESQRLGPVRRVLDTVFYRGVAGYLVRPRHPLTAFLLLLVLGGLLRALRGGRRGLPALFSGLHASVRGAFSKQSGITAPEGDRAGPYVLAAVLWAEFLAHKALFAVFLMSLGNSNATVRQLIDAVVRA